MKRISSIFFIILYSISICHGDDTLSEKNFVAKANYSYKNIDIGETDKSSGERKYQFHVKNTGNAPLVFTYVHASCGCMRLTYPRHPIAPGDSTTISVIFNPGNLTPGSFNRGITVRSNAEEPAIHLSITGKIKE